MPTDRLPEPAARAVLAAVQAYVLVYLVLFCLLQPLDGLPGVALLFHAWPTFVEPVVCRLSEVVLGVAATVHATGSTDTAFHWALCVLCLLLAVPLVGLISRLPGHTRQRARLLAETYLRLSLALVLAGYGLVKVFPQQFPPPTVDRLLQRVGDTSSMGLLWTFMGASRPYSALAGAGELLAALLLTMRRTALLGAILATGLLANVVALNLCYDVAVKLYSSHLLAMASVLVARDARRLWAVFVAHAPLAAAPPPSLFATPWLHRSALAARTLLVLGVTVMGVADAAQDDGHWTQRLRDPLHGLWRVVVLEGGPADDSAEPPGPDAVALRERLLQARYLVVDMPGFLALVDAEATRERYVMDRDDAAHTLALAPRWSPEPAATLRYELTDANAWELVGTCGGRHLHLALERAQPPTATLGARPFRWIQEHSFNH